MKNHELNRHFFIFQINHGTNKNVSSSERQITVAPTDHFLTMYSDTNFIAPGSPKIEEKRRLVDFTCFIWCIKAPPLYCGSFYNRESQKSARTVLIFGTVLSQPCTLCGFLQLPDALNWEFLLV